MLQKKDEIKDKLSTIVDEMFELFQENDKQVLLGQKGIDKEKAIEYFIKINQGYLHDIKNIIPKEAELN